MPVGVNVPPLPLNDVLEQAAGDFGTTPAIAFVGRVTTYRTLLENTALLAGSLAELGVRRGDRVAIILPNCPQLITTFFAVVRLGAIAVPVDPGIGADGIRDRLADCGARTALVIDSAYASVAAILDRTQLRDLIVTSVGEAASMRARLSARLPGRAHRELRQLLDHRDYPTDAGVIFYDELIEGSPGPVEPAQVEADRDIAAILYTAGSTGPARGAVVTHRNLVAAVCQSAVWDRLLERGHEAALVCVPMHTPSGLTLGLIGTVFAAGTLLVVPPGTPELLVRCAREWMPSTFPASPQAYQDLLALPDGRRESLRRGLRGLRTSLSVGARLSAAVTDDLRVRTGVRATEAYGLAETCGVALANPLNANARPGTVGIPLPGTDACILDERDPTKVLPVGAAGELAIRGPQVCRGYWNRSEAAVRGGWLATGDIAVMSPDGYVTIIDRKPRSEPARAAVALPRRPVLP